MTDIRVVLLQQQKLTTEVEHLKDTVTSHAEDIRELRRDIKTFEKWAIGGFVGLALLGFAAVAWTNTQIQQQSHSISDVNASVSAIKEDVSQTRQDIQDIKENLTQDSEKKAAH